MEATTREGVLTKNHRGGPLGTTQKQRYFYSAGFHVFYYEDRDKHVVNGHFDLRNVTQCTPSADPMAPKGVKGAPGAIDLYVAEKKLDHVKKILTVCFVGNGSDEETEGWLTLWCSAIDSKYVHTSLRKFINLALTDKLNRDFSTQPGLSIKKAAFAKNPKVTSVLTPRSATSRSQPSTPREAPKVVLDTPREAPMPEMPSTSQAPVAQPPAAAPASLPPDLPHPDEMEEPEAEADDDSRFEVTVPEGVLPGQKIIATTPTGVKVKLIVPEGAEPGMILTFELPPSQDKAATRIQAALRGKQSRSQSRQRPNAPIPVPQPSPLPLPVPELEPESVDATEPKPAAAPAPTTPSEPPLVPEPTIEKASEPMPVEVEPEPVGTAPTANEDVVEVQAKEAAIDTSDTALAQSALKVQSVYRGHSARTARHEEARVQWLQYYMMPDIAKWDKAMELAVTPEEEEEIRKAQGLGADEEEKRRLQWLKHYTETGNFEKAFELAVDEKEQADVMKAKTTAASHPCSCFTNKEAVERERKEKFMTAMMNYEWEIAKTLAVSKEEFDDIEDSVTRVNTMFALKARGEYALAMEQAITEAERKDIADYQMKVVEELTKEPPTAEMNAAAAKVQAMLRGQQVRDGLAKKEMEKAAIKVQSVVRGQKTRDQIEEDRRQQWVTYFINEGKFDEALSMALTMEEQQAIMKAKSDSLKPSFCACFGNSASTNDQERQVKFAQAIRTYDWDLAEALAVTQEEKEDVVDSIGRVQWMKHHTTEKEFDKALALAITDTERQAIEDAARM